MSAVSTPELKDPQTEWSRMVMSAFADAGVRELVLSPGSRSTPLALAAAGEPRLRIHTILDERAAAFFALGQARVTGVPSLLLCTSGSAPAHYLPAVVEAHHARIPLLVLTADRPLEAQHAGAHQTIDQARLFGARAKFFELGGVDAAEGALRGTRRLIAQAYALSSDGGVHLDVRIRKPLEPTPATDEERAASTRIRAAADGKLVRFCIAERRTTSIPEALRARIVEEPAGIIAVGPLAHPDAALRAALLELSARSGYPLVVEPTSQLGAGLSGALSTVYAGTTAPRPRVIVQVGPPPVAASYERLVASAVHLEIFAHSEEVDADSRAHAVHVGDPASVLLELARSLPALQREPVLQASHDHVGRALLAALAPTDELASVVAIARCAARRAALVFVGNSLPVRELAAATALVPGCTLASHHQRGASGIDGLCAGAAGLASHGTPTLLLLGDVSLLHDLHGAWLAAQATTPLVIAVVCNGGGRIFETLPIGRREDLASALPLFTTPVAPDLAALARFCGMRHARTDAAAQVEAAVDAALEHPGATLLELVVEPTSAARWSARLSKLVDDALGATS
ncbi:MAG: 2-succinyl-5-enolpyruvyl-6-hydroxy-3-cyclohexene-1-carboxylic-acid synthase [Polyangia bacterium]